MKITKKYILSVSAFIFLFLFALFTYRYGLIEGPKKDHQAYILERGLVDNDWQWFRHSLSFSRVRFSHPGDYYLYRPGHFAVLALEDLGYRNNLLAQGILSVLMHSLAAFSLYLLIRLLVAPWLALLLAVLFLCQYAGMEISLWRHITPYILSLTFFTLGTFFLIKNSEKNKTLYILSASCFIFLATLFHEVIFLTTVGLGMLFFLLNYPPPKIPSTSLFSNRTIRLFFILPFLAYILLNLTDYLLYMPEMHLIGPSDVIREPFSCLGVAKKVWRYFFAVNVSIWFPSQIQTTMLPGEYFHYWNFIQPRNPFYGLLILISTPLAGAFILYIFILSIRDYRRGSLEWVNVVYISFAVLLLALILGLSIGRSYLRGPKYILGASYYYAMSGFILCGLIATAIRKIETKIANASNKRILHLSVAMVVFCLIVINYIRVQDDLRMLYPHKMSFKNKLNSITRIFSSHPEYCYAGIDINTLNRAIPGSGISESFFYLWEYQCGRDKDCPQEKKPVYLSGDPQGYLWLAELTTSTDHSLPTEFLRWRSISSDVLSGGLKNIVMTPGDLPTKGEKLFLSEDNFQDRNFAAKISNGIDCGMIYAYQDRNNFSFMAVEKSRAYGRTISQGIISPPQNITILPGRISQTLELQVFFSEDRIYLFGNGYWLTALKRDNRPGKIGVFAVSNKRKTAIIYDFRVSPDCSTNFNVTLIPKIKIRD